MVFALATVLVDHFSEYIARLKVPHFKQLGLELASAMLKKKIFPFVRNDHLFVERRFCFPAIATRTMPFEPMGIATLNPSYAKTAEGFLPSVEMTAVMRVASGERI
jgi:hypothetical protein